MLTVLPGTQQLQRIGTETLRGVEDVFATIGAVAAIAVIQLVTVVGEGQNTAIDLDRHEPGLRLSPAQITQASHRSLSKRNSTRSSKTAPIVTGKRSRQRFNEAFNRVHASGQV